MCFTPDELMQLLCLSASCEHCSNIVGIYSFARIVSFRVCCLALRNWLLLTEFRVHHDFVVVAGVVSIA